MSLFGLVPNEMTHSHSIDNNSVIQAALAGGLTLAAIAGLYKVLNKKVVDPMLGTEEQSPIQPEAQLPTSQASPTIIVLPSGVADKIASVLGITKTAEEVVMGQPIEVDGKMVVPTETKYINYLPSIAINSGPAALGNLMASRSANTSSLTNALLSILAGTAAGTGLNYASKNMVSGPLTGLAALGVGALGSGAAAYGVRSLLDRAEE